MGIGITPKAGLLLASALWALPPGEAVAQTRPTVVELYTSEGCSSCPPAEAQIGALAQQPGILALAFHVDYWDSLGWRDRFALPIATQRQRDYAEALRLPSVYTPQLVIDGRRDLVGGASLAALRSAAASGAQGAAVPIELSIQAQSLLISVPAASTGAASDVLLIGYLPAAVSKVMRGENAGRELHEFNIVRSLERLGGWHGQAQQFRVALADLPPDASSVAVLLQQHGRGPILGAASTPLR
jgi:hypothetical protein